MEKKEGSAEKQARLRSRLYPRYDLEESIRFVQSIYKLGGIRVSNQAVAAEIGKAITNSGFTGRVSSAKQFGLLIQEAGKLTVSSLAKEILVPRGDAEKASATRLALASPELYKELIGNLGGKMIPDQTGLANLLFHDYKVELVAKDSASRNFIRSAQYANTLRNGIFVISDEDVAPEQEQDQEVEIDQHKSATRRLTPNKPSDVNISPVTKDVAFQDNGAGWSVIIKSAKPLNSATKMKLIEVAELLDTINAGEQASLDA